MSDTDLTGASAGPLLTAQVSGQLSSSRIAGLKTLVCSLDLDRSSVSVELERDNWIARRVRYPYLDDCKERTIYHWVDNSFQPVARYGSSLIKLVPTEWGPPTFEIDGIKMLPSAQVSPYLDARAKVALIRPRDKTVLDCCGGLGYFAAWCAAERAAHIISFEKNADVIWLRSVNPWSPPNAAPLTLTHADVTEAILTLADASVDAALHDPPRFGIAGELYSRSFYVQLARVLKRRGRLFHYTGSPNKRSSGRDLAQEVAARLRETGFSVTKTGDGILAIRL